MCKCMCIYVYICVCMYVYRVIYSNWKKIVTIGDPSYNQKGFPNEDIPQYKPRVRVEPS